MGKMDKLKEAFGHSKDDEAAPPPYAEDAAPEYSIPRLHPTNLVSSQPSSSGVANTAAGTLVFAPKFGCHYKRMSVYLGTSKDNLTHAISRPKLWGQPETILRTTADKESAPLASAGRLKGSNYLKSLIRVPARPGGDRTDDLEIEMSGDYEISRRFHLQVGADRHTETFEWRNSNGKEVREIGQSRLGRGYKLVRLGGADEPVMGRGGERQERELGFTSMGEEIVAVGAHTNGWTSGPDFAFMGTGLTGAFGETWEIVAVISWLRIVELAQQQAAAASASA